MSLYPKPSPDEIRGPEKKRRSTTTKRGRNEQKAQEVWQKLQDALRHGITVCNTLWLFRMTDWVVGIHAVDLDGDGEIEILLASRDGWIKTFTRFGSLKWEKLLNHEQYINALAIVPAQAEKQAEQQPRIIVGLRDGQVIALDKEGKRLENWLYSAKRIIRQIYISSNHPENVLIASEDRCIHVLDSATGELRWIQHTQGWVRCVLAADIDSDGEEEILCGSGDKHLYVFDASGRLLHTFDTGHQIYALAVSPPEMAGPVRIIMSSNRKDLSSWEVTRPDGVHWHNERLWLSSTTDKIRLIENRGHAICVLDIDGDGMPEILVSSEDGYLVVVDYHGQHLWKQNFRSCVYRLSAADINHDGQVEILVGTENHYAYVIQFDLAKNLSRQIRDLYAQLTQLYQWSWGQIAEKLALRESTMLKDFVEKPSLRPRRMEMEEGQHLMEEGKHKAALVIFLRLLGENIQYCWSQPFTTTGYVWAGSLSKPGNSPDPNLVVGTDQGYIYDLDTHCEQGEILWLKQFGENASYRVRFLCSGPQLRSGNLSIIAVLSNYRLALLDSQGQILQELTLEKEASDWARCAYYYPGQNGAEGAIIIGMENDRITFWDKALQKQTGSILLPEGEGVGAICAYDIMRTGHAQIISGTLKNHVYAHTWEGEYLWHFTTRDRVQVLRVADIDNDGRAEIIVGAEDRNLYVLDNEGNLKWRYRTRRGVMDIDVCDIQMEKDPGDPAKRTLKVLVSSADGFLYMFNAHGDLVWRYQSSNRARVVRAADMNGDGHYEIALASEDQVELLQIVNRAELLALVNICWEKITAHYTDLALLRNLAEDPDEYIRGRALSRLAGSLEHTEEDFRRLLQAQREDKSFQVKRDLIRSIVNLYQAGQYQQARQLLERMYQDPDEEVRDEVLWVLPLLGETLSFEYLERSIDYPDLWIRQTVVKRLDQLVEKYPRKSLRLLLKTALSEDEWVRQESGRSLAHFFDISLASLVPDLFTLLEQGTDLGVFQQIATSLREPVLKGFFLNLLHQFQASDVRNLAKILDEAIHWIDAINEREPLYGEDLLQVYEEFRQIFRAHTISLIAGYQRVTRPDILSGPSTSLAQQLVPAFDALEKIAGIIATYERRRTIGERISSLLQAEQELEKVRAGLQQYLFTYTQPSRPTAHFPQTHILQLLVEQWAVIVRTELARMKGSAHLICKLGTTGVPDEDEVVVVLNVRNDGQCAADNVFIELEESADFEVRQGKEHTLTEISTQFPQKVQFVLHLHTPRARLLFHLTYDDAEDRRKKQAFADEVMIQRYHRRYHLISNPYTTGTPIREHKMFYGRKEDLDFLYEILGSQASNRVVVLWGQRRMGKTSLVYQLANRLAAGQYAPVFIDLQKLALVDTVSQLLENFAQHIADEIWSYKKYRVPGPDHEQFLADPSNAFLRYLASVEDALPSHRLVLLIDEFDGISRYIQREGDDILHYLRNLMQHYPGLNFLLSSAPLMPYMEGYQSVFFNIARERHLGKLKPEEAIELITGPVCNDLEYDPLAVDRMLELTDSWPYFIHVLSEKLIQHCNAIRKAYATIGEVNAALHLVLEEQASSIRWIWQDLSSPTEKLLLSLLAQEKQAEGRIFTLNDIRRDFDTYGVLYEPRTVIEALSKLKRGELIEERADGLQYYIPVGLIKAWLCKEKPPERVIREENFFDDEQEC